MLSDAGRDTEAKAAFDRFIAHQPESAPGYTARARALMKAKNAASASEDFAAAISHSSPPDPALFIEHSRALHATGRVPEAIQTLDAGIAKLGPLIALAQEAIAIEEAAGHFPEALARIEKVIQSAPRKERWLVRRAALLEKMERPREARVALIAARAAIESLTADRRASAAMTELAAEIDAALARIGPR